MIVRDMNVQHVLNYQKRKHLFSHLTTQKKDIQYFKAVIERRSQFSIKLLDHMYVAIHLERIKSLLNREDAVASRLDMGYYRQYVDELEHNWDDNIYMGCCVVRKEDQAEKPIAVGIASASTYRADVRRPMELNW